MNTDMVPTFSAETITSDYHMLCEGVMVGGKNCGQRGYYVSDPSITDWPNYFCEDHLLDAAVGTEIMHLVDLGYYSG